MTKLHCVFIIIRTLSSVGVEYDNVVIVIVVVPGVNYMGFVWNVTFCKDRTEAVKKGVC